MKVGDIIEIAGVRSLITYIDEEGVAHAINDDGTVCCLWATETAGITNIKMDLKYILCKLNMGKDDKNKYVN